MSYPVIFPRVKNEDTPKLLTLTDPKEGFVEYRTAELISELLFVHRNHV